MPHSPDHTRPKRSIAKIRDAQRILAEVADDGLRKQHADVVRYIDEAMQNAERERHNTESTR